MYLHPYKIYLIKKMKILNFKVGATILFGSLIFQQCAIIRPGEIGIKQTLGKIKGKPSVQGMRWYNPFVSKVVILNMRNV